MDIGLDNRAVSANLLAFFDAQLFGMYNDDAMDSLPRFWLDPADVAMQARLAWKLVEVEQTEPPIGSVIPELESERFEAPAIGVIQDGRSQHLIATQSFTARLGTETAHQIRMNEHCNLRIRMEGADHHL